MSEYQQPHKYGATRKQSLTVNDKPRSIAFQNPGGIAGVWAEENTRDAIFNALKRRETFATSGPRIAPRFFAGWDIPESLCCSERLADEGYRLGAPMGGVLSHGETNQRALALWWPRALIRERRMNRVNRCNACKSLRDGSERMGASTSRLSILQAMPKTAHQLTR